MELKTFKAPTLAETVLQVKRALGHDAIILHTRTYKKPRWFGLRRCEMVEITAAKNVAVKRRPPRGQTNANQPLLWSAGQQATSQPSLPPRPTGLAPQIKSVLDTPVVNTVVIRDISDQMKTLKEMIKELSGEVHKQAKPQVREELFDLYTLLISRRVNDEVCAELMAGLQRVLRPEQYQQPEIIKLKLVELMEKMIPVAGPTQRIKTVGPHVIALIGPTGVGKTTTIAKLAANFKLRDRRKVGLITIDTYRIAAIDQLKKYADILCSQLKVVTSPEDLRAAVESFADCDYVLIDTAGRSPTDALKLHELKAFLTAAAPDEVHMVVSATVNQDCAELAIDRFSDVRIDRMIFTKLDEVENAGLLLNIVRKFNKPLSYTTHGQNVPDDIEVTRGPRLANRILGNNV